MKKNILTLSLFLFTFHLYAQTAKTKTRPDLPGTFLVEFGFNRALDAADNFSTGFWGSRTVNLYYQYDVRILKSRFSIVPGLGLGMERFKFKNNYTLAYEGDVLMMDKTDLDIKKSQLVTNYLDVPIELRYTSNPENPNRSFKMAAGFRAGVLISSFTKLKYDDDDETLKIKTRRDWNLNPYRYGVYGKIGTGNFNIFWYQNLSTLFKTGKGPDEHDINTATFGISIGGF